ncbi:condensation domain-containing protein [Amycolatopsis albispora]|uniref:Uncharacterized protein n=1 Tax=Amycolatopsis albispora TaxID=1804986 RepID=A0A344L5F9_9PSEU|nr:condensation domain-containing protein [Amycolatopsis albispora]AXB43283.1 hypothetical protein A4R43_12565 [Amycolatopsis albispora]
MTGTRENAAEPIAVTGVALALPGATDLDGLHAVLSAGEARVGQPGADRLAAHGERAGRPYLPFGYLDRIDRFDHEFFGLSQREAELTDPHHRLGLQLVYQALEHAGHAPAGLRGSRTAVVFSAPAPDQPAFGETGDPQRILGTLPAAAAARVAYLFDFRGPALVVDTACSGGLASVVIAVRELRAGRAELAVAGGLSVRPVLTPEVERPQLPGLFSPTGMCRPFDADADGTVGGEGGGFAVLKPLAAALADGDRILGVLRGTGMNQNGFRATGMSAPSPQAQAEAITEAWTEAGVDGVDYVECHGSGTPLGDVTEVAGLRLVTDGPLAIGSLKANFGHLDHAAGFAGLVKVLAALRHRTLYPTPHFTTPHPLIEFGDGIEVNPVARPWPAPAGRPRRAGVSSFGLTGTNVHVVVEEAPGSPARTAPVRSAELVTVSAKTPAALGRRLDQLADFAERTTHDLRSVARALNRGFDDHRHRRAFVAEDTGELAASLRAAASAPATPAVAAAPPVTLLFSGDGRITDSAWTRTRADFPDRLDEAAQPVARQWGLAGLLGALGLPEARMAGSGAGNLAIQVLRGRLTRTAAIEQARGRPGSSEVDEAGLARMIRRLVTEHAVAVELGSDGVLSRRIREAAPGLTVVPLLSAGGRRDVLTAIGRLYEAGVDVDWARFHGPGGPRVEVPVTTFDPVSFGHHPKPEPAPLDPAAGAEAVVARLFARLLGAPAVAPQADYFELGGTSLAGIAVLREAEHRFGVRITFADLFRHRTPRELGALIEARRTGQAADPRWAVEPVPRTGHLPLSVNQEQLWYLDQLNPGSPLYNIPVGLRYRGPLDHEVLRHALRAVAARHEILRVRMPAEDGVPGLVADGHGPVLKVADLAGAPEHELRARTAAEASTPFDLATGPLLRVLLIRLGPADHLLMCTWHHIIFDGWTPAVFLRDLSECYAARQEGRPPELPRLAIQYADYASWQRSWLAGPEAETALRFWRGKLAGLTTRELPLDHPRPPVPSHRGELLWSELPAPTAERVREFGRARGVTTFVTLLAVLNTVLHRWSGDEDVVVGAATSGRSNPATHELIGYFNNVLPFRTAVHGCLTFTELLARCATTATEVLDHEEMPFARIVSALNPARELSRHPVFTVAYTHQNTAAHAGPLGAATMTPDRATGFGIAPGTAKFDLTFGVIDQNGGAMHCYLEYALDLFDAATAAQLLELHRAVTEAAITTPDRRLDELVPFPRRVG